MPAVMLALGAYRFSVETAAYQSLKRTAEYRWAALDRFAAPPAHQYLGPGDQEIALAGVIYPHYRGGLGQVAAMRAEAGRGVPLLLVSGLGENLGRWVIRAVGEAVHQVFERGAPRRIDFDLRLAAYGEDGVL